MRISPTSKEWLVLIRRAAAFGGGFGVWTFCRSLYFKSSAQTGMIVPVDIQVSRDIVRWVWFPFSWLPSPIYINDFWSILKGLLIGVPYGAVTALVILWLLRTSRQKKM